MEFQSKIMLYEKVTPAREMTPGAALLFVLQELETRASA
jgi:hypothetical protein